MEPNELRRYTNLPAVIRMLQEKEITLLSPETWDDINDRRLLEAFRRGKKLKSVLSLCFAQAAETYHHWKVFSDGTDGMCVVFDKERLTAALPKAEVLHKPVTYYTVGRLSAEEPPLDELPFSKRIAYEPESEYRLLWISKNKKMSSKDFPFPQKAVIRVIINPWLPKPLAKSVTSTLHAIPGWENLDVRQSTVTDGPAWKELADKHS